MSYQNIIGKICFYRPMYQDKLVEAVIADVVAYDRLDGTTTEYAVFENGDQAAVSALLFRNTTDPIKAFKQFIDDTGITPRMALLLAQQLILEEKVKELSRNVGFDGKPLA